MAHLLYQGNNSVFYGKVKEDLKPEEALQNLQDKLNELSKDQLLKEAQGLGKAQSVEEEISKETHEGFESLLDEVKLFAEESDALSTLEELLKRICSILENALEYIIKPITTEKKEGWLFSLLRKFLSRRLSWEEMLDAEIAELKEKLENDDLSAEERAEIMKRLKVLQEIKLHKITAIGLIIGIIASFLGFGAAVARSGEIVRDAIEKLSNAQEAEEKKCEKGKETEDRKAEDKAKEEAKEKEEENKRKCNELRESIFKELSEKRVPPESAKNALVHTFGWLDDMGRMVHGIIQDGKCERQKGVDGKSAREEKEFNQHTGNKGVAQASDGKNKDEPKCKVEKVDRNPVKQMEQTNPKQQTKNVVTEAKNTASVDVAAELKQQMQARRQARQARLQSQVVPSSCIKSVCIESVNLHSRTNHVAVNNGRGIVR